ncbi:pif5 [Lambdina fiscellaria nucleopolyhedrovirus]|uniref:Pif5 n=1 Tax=Lambdina fiscellaria nucleopolyhedrovirus TaxID=1642929 RepID=A0A0E3URE1_9ABAC|nr:pif5 [Lambdina fiscellaria nucleopolyhedrovirus]AKC91760.1 pif5 [Lambdina fiscellaria nucleopolyhedrovirus]
MSFLTNLRRVNKLYPNNSNFVLDNNVLRNISPAGFTNVFNAPTTRNLGSNRFQPGYNLGNNRFVSTSDVNRVMRNNDSAGIRNIFSNANNNQIDSLGLLRRADNVPDAGLHSSFLRRNAVKQNYPSTMTRSSAGVQNVLNNNPRLASYLQNLKTAGTVLLLGAGVYLTFSAITLVQDIIEALNRVGGSYYVRGNNGGDEYQICMLVERTCLHPNTADTDVNYCDFDPLISDPVQLRALCNGYDYETEKTVCRASDPSADPLTPQYVDISDLAVGQTITCIEPYDMGDLIGDLGLDNLLGDEGILTNSSNVSKSVSNNLIPVLLLIGGLLLLAAVAFLIFKRMMMTKTVNIDTKVNQK